MKRRLWSLLTATLALALAVSGLAVAAPPSASGDANAGDYVIVTLPSPAAAQYEGGIPGLERTKPLRGRFDPNSQAYQNYRRHLEDEHGAFLSSLRRVAPRAEVVREYFAVLNGFAIKLNGHRPEDVARAQGAQRVGNSWLYRPTMNTSVDLINADDVWGSLGGRAEAGSGIKVGVIDSGIDDSHVFFDCKDGEGGDSIPGITHKVYASGVALGPINPYPDIVFDHGTHVAGTIGGCVTDGSTASPVQVSGHLSGVAPGAELHDYNVFPGYGAGFWAFGGSAFSHDIAAALEDAVLDGMDVVNMSLGGSVQGPHDFLAEASNATVDAGIVVVVAAGNSGPGDMTVESPGSAEKVITAGASTNGHLGGVPVTVTGFDDPFVAAAGDFGPYGTPVGGDLIEWSSATGGDTTGCNAVGTVLTGDPIVLIDRGACTFTTKVRNAQDAGAIGVVVVNNVAGPPSGMAHDNTEPKPTILAVMVSQSDGGTIRSGLPATATIGGAAEEFPATPNVLAGFSSRGPTPFTYLIKPDVVAPGVNVYSSVFNDQFAFFQGTSMATPHVAGAAALLLHAHIDWGPAEVKSALVNRANAGIVTGLPNDRATPLQIGNGLIQVDLAADAGVFASPVSVSFGLWNGNKGVSASREVTLWSATSGSCTVAATGDVSVPSSVDSNGAFEVSLEGGRDIPTGDHWGTITVDCGDDVFTIPWWVRVDRKGNG